MEEGVGQSPGQTRPEGRALSSVRAVGGRQTDSQDPAAPGEGSRLGCRDRKPGRWLAPGAQPCVALGHRCGCLRQRPASQRGEPPGLSSERTRKQSERRDRRERPRARDPQAARGATPPPGQRRPHPSFSSRTEEPAAQQPPRSQAPVANGAGGSRGSRLGGAGWRVCSGALVLVAGSPPSELAAKAGRPLRMWSHLSAT